jgi:hypothetical protein
VSPAGFRSLFGLVIVGTMAALAWWKAPDFDPYSATFFTKQYVAPYAEMPRDFRIGGTVFAAIGGLIMLAGLKTIWRRQLTWRQAGVGIVGSLLVIAFGSAFFVAASSAERRIEQQQAGTNR